MGGIDDKIDAIEATDFFEEFLRRCDIDEDDGRIDAGDGFGDDRRDAQRDGTVAGKADDRIANFQMIFCGNTFA